MPLEVPQKNVVDSSGWIEYFADGPNAGFFEAAILDAGSLVVPSISIYEVFKRLLAGIANTLNQTTFLFGTAHLRARPVFPRSSSNEAALAHDAEWSNVTTRHCKGRGCGGRKPPPVEALRALVQGLNRRLDLPLMGFVNHCAGDFSILTAISSQPIPF